MAINSEVAHLKTVLANYFLALSEIFPKLESIEKEATVLADKLHDHLEQAAICQRLVRSTSIPLNVDWLVLYLLYLAVGIRNLILGPCSCYLQIN
jgi:hypothetical protein